MCSNASITEILGINDNNLVILGNKKENIKGLLNIIEIFIGSSSSGLSVVSIDISHSLAATSPNSFLRRTDLPPIDPMNIINDIEESFVDSKCQVLKIVDRSQAILKGIEIAQPGDMVIVAGKGHEKYQIIHGERVFYDEKAEVLKAIEIVKDRQDS